MSEAAAQKTVLAVLIVGGAIIAWDGIKRKGKATPGGRQLVSLTVLAAALAVGATVAPSFAGPLSVLILLGLVITKVGGGK